MTETLLPEILKLSVDERIELAGKIWDSVDAEAQDDEPAEMLPNQKAELLRVIEKYTEHPELLIPIESALARLRE